MAHYMTMLMILAAFSSASAIPTVSLKSQDLVIATEEMVRANYFAFVMLINMSLDSRIQENITFLMPNDRLLSTAIVNQNAVSDFLLRHSIPSPLLFDHLERIPSGSTIPSCEPNYLLNVYNNGRKSFSLNNVKIISPNICTAGSSIRCHGVDGILSETFYTPSHSSCSSSNTSPNFGAAPPEPAPSLPLPPPPLGDSGRIPVTAPPPDHEYAGPRKSGSCRSRSLLSRGALLLKFLMIYVLWRQ